MKMGLIEEVGEGTSKGKEGEDKKEEDISSDEPEKGYEYYK